MRLLEYASDLYDWWRWEIAGLLPRRQRDDGTQASATLRIGRHGVEVSARGRDPLLVDDPDAVGAAVRGVAGGSGWLDADLLIEPDRYLRRPLSPLRLPRSRAVAMSRLDYAAATPFRADEAFLFIPRYDEAVPETAYCIVRRRHLEPVLDSLRRARVEVRRLGFVEADRIAWPDARSAAEAARPPARERVLRAAGRWAAVTAAAGLLVAFGAAHWRYAVASRALDREIAAAETKASAVRSIAQEREQRISRIAAARSAKSEAVPLTRVLEEMARAIPDTTWLTDIDFRGTSVSFTGVSESAADLIPVLEASPLFRTPTFTQPVVRAEEGGERFTITMELEEPANG